MNDTKNSLKPYAMQSALLWSCIPILWSFLVIYFDEKGLSSSQIGILVAINPVMAILAQPFFGLMADKASSKNNVFIMLMVGTIASIVIFPLNDMFWYMLIVTVILSIFQSALTPIAESIMLESLDKMNKTYGPVRMAGTLGFSSVCIIASFLMKIDIRSIFIISAVMGFFNIITMKMIPSVRGHRVKGNDVSVIELLKNKTLVIFMVFWAIAQLALSFYYTFFPIYFLRIGGTNSQIAWVYFLAGMSELPFLFWADRIIEKLGIKTALVLSMFIIGFRTFLVSSIGNPIFAFPLGLLSGLTFIVFAYSLAIYVNKNVRAEFRTTGQTFLGIAAAIGRILGALLGGFLVEEIGLAQSMRLTFYMCIIAIVFFIFVNMILKKKEKGRALNI